LTKLNTYLLKTLSILVFLLWHSHVSAQVDSGKYKHNARADTGARAAYRNALNKKTDSNARAGIRNKATEAVAYPFNQAKALPQDKWKQLKSKIPARKNIFRFTGEVRSEIYYTTFQNPLMRNEPMYSRLYISPTLILFGLPFKANFFFTTEANNTWKNNFFSIRFDANAMRQQAMKDIQKQLDEAKKLDRLRLVDLQRNILETKRYEQEMEKMKKKIPDLDELQSELNNKAKEKAMGYIESEKAKLEERLRTASEEEKEKLEREFWEKQDSVINHYKKQAGDSALSAKGQAMSAVDTAKLGKYLRMQSKVDELKSRKQKIENLRHLDSAELAEKLDGIRNPDDIRAMAKDKLPDRKLLNSMLAVDRFGIGLVNPQYSEFTLFASSIKGMDIGVNKDKYFYDLTLGKTTRQFTGLFSDNKPVYDRNMGVARIGYGQLSGNQLAAEYLYAFDQVNEDKTQSLIKNGVMNISARFTMLRNTTVEANAAQSSYKEQYHEQQSNYTSSGNIVFDASANRAYQLKATQTVGENTKVEGQIKQTGAAFRTVGNPFLRRNFREAEFKYYQLFFKKKLKFSGFYKEMRDNLIELNKATNRLKGYGLKLSTAFEKYPNVSLSYSPYQQGNNHPDSIYRTNNQFSITNAIITYKKRFKAFFWTGMANYTRSAMELNDRGTVAYKMISTLHTLQVGSRNTSVLSYLSNVTAPFVDSLNSNSFQVSHTYLAKKTMSVGAIGEHTLYKNGAFRSGGGLQVTTALLKNFTLSLLARYDRINKLWQLDNANVFTGRVVMVWRW
jgi:hypothetical protein